MLPIFCLSVSHKKAPVRILESLYIEDPASALNRLKEKGAQECVIIQTCHRVELYAIGPNINRCMLKDFLKEVTQSTNQIEFYAEFFDGEDAIRHLFYLAAGLESVIIGETEILHQVHDSLQLAKVFGTAKSITESIFSAAINCGRIVRQKTFICKGSVSLGNLVIKIILNELGSLERKKLVIIGAGKIGCMIAKAIPRRGTVTVFVANRTYSRAERLANEVGGIAVKFEKLKEVVANADAIVCATSSPHLVLKRKDLEDLGGKNRLLIVDVSNPRGVDERLKDLAGVKLVDLDQLNSIAKSNLKIREKAIEDAKEIIELSLIALNKRLQLNEGNKSLERLMRWAEVKRQRALEVVFRKGAFTEYQKKVVENFTYAFMRDLITSLANSEIKLESISNGTDNYI